jgi:arsenate reductase
LCRILAKALTAGSYLCGMKWTIYHNPRCRKSREALALLDDRDIQPEVRLYLQDPPSAAELRQLLKKLKVPALQLVRKEEALYKERYKGRDLSEKEWIEAMTAHPILIQRPVVIRDDRAVIGRPPEEVLQLID